MRRTFSAEQESEDEGGDRAPDDEGTPGRMRRGEDEPHRVSDYHARGLWCFNLLRARLRHDHGAAMNSLPLGPFAIDLDDATLAPRTPGVRPELRFAWRGRPCQAALAPHAMRLAAIAARIPSTADPAADRPATLEALADLPLAMPEGWRLRLLPDHRVSVEADEPFEGPPTAVAVVSRLVRFALALDPYLDRLEAAGTEPPGKANT